MALYCLCHLLGSQKMTRIVSIDETFISHNLPFCASVLGFARVLTRSRVIARVKRKGLVSGAQIKLRIQSPLSL